MSIRECVCKQVGGILNLKARRCVQLALIYVLHGLRKEAGLKHCLIWWSGSAKAGWQVDYCSKQSEYRLIQEEGKGKS